MISSDKINIIINALKPYHPNMIGIFGSYARNDATKESDLDILYNSPINSISLFEHVRLARLLEERLNMKVDLVSENAIHPQLKPSIYKDLQLIYEC